MILLVGATGALGQRIAQRLCERGEVGRALVRARSDATELELLGAEIARGDLLDPASLRAACDGVGTVISTATAISRLLAGTSSHSIHEVDEVGGGT